MQGRLIGQDLLKVVQEITDNDGMEGILHEEAMIFFAQTSCSMSTISLHVEDTLNDVGIVKLPNDIFMARACPRS